MLILSDATQTVLIKPGEFALLITHEAFKLPMDIVGNLGAKTYFTRKGLVLLAGMQIDPGFEGVLTLAVYNCSPKSIMLEYLQDICSIQFFRLARPATKLPVYPEELRAGRLPRVEKDYFKDLEVRNLSEIAQDLRVLSQNVGALTTSVSTLSRLFWAFVVPSLLAILGGVFFRR